MGDLKKEKPFCDENREPPNETGFYWLQASQPTFGGKLLTVSLTDEAKLLVHAKQSIMIS